MASRSLSSIAWLGVLLVSVACSPNGDDPLAVSNDGGSGGSGSGAVTCPPDPNFNGESPVVSLQNDLLADPSADKPAGGVFRRACSGSACHGEDAKGAHLFIAPPARDMSRMPIPLTKDHMSRLLGSTDGVLRMAQTVTTMPIVDPGKPANSLLMRKMDGCFKDIANRCTPVDNGPPPCGDEMPWGTDILGIEERDLVRRWIYQGAKSDLP